MSSPCWQTPLGRKGSVGSTSAKCPSAYFAQANTTIPTDHHSTVPKHHSQKCPCIDQLLHEINAASALLPQGDPGNGNTLTIIARIADRYGAIATLQTDIHVVPLVLNTSQLKALADKMLADAAAAGDTSASGRAVLGIAASLNSNPNDTSGESIRETLLDSVDGVMNGIQMSSADVEAQSQIVGQVLGSAALTSNAQDKGVLILNSLVDAGDSVGGMIPTAGKAALSGLDKIVVSEQAATNKTTNPSKATHPDMCSRAFSTVDRMGSSMRKRSVCGEDPVDAAGSSLGMKSGKNYAEDLAGSELAIDLGATQATGDKAVQTKFSMPPGIRLSGCLNTQMKTVRCNPYAHLNKDQKVAGALASLDLGVPVNGLSSSDSIVITIPANSKQLEEAEKIVKAQDEAARLAALLASSSNSTNSTSANSTAPEVLTNSTAASNTFYGPVCRYWVPEMQMFMTEGCKLIATCNNSIVCRCSHLKDFAAMVSAQVTIQAPQINIVDPIADAKLLLNLLDNPFPLFVVGGLVSACILFAILAWRRDVNQAKVVISVARNKSKKTLKDTVAQSFGTLNSKHEWLAIYYRDPDDPVTRPMYVILFFVELMAAMFANAMFYSDSEGGTAQQLMVGLLCSVVIFPIAFPIGWLFEKIGSPLSQTVRHSLAVGLEPEKKKKKKKKKEKVPLSTEIYSKLDKLMREAADPEAGEDEEEEEEVGKGWIIFTWTFVVNLITVLSYFLLIYALKFEKGTAEDWLLSDVYSTVFEGGILNPVKVLGSSLILAALVHSLIGAVIHKKHMKARKKTTLSRVEQLDEAKGTSAEKREKAWAKWRSEVAISMPQLTEVAIQKARAMPEQLFQERDTEPIERRLPEPLSSPIIRTPRRLSKMSTERSLTDMTARRTSNLTTARSTTNLNATRRASDLNSQRRVSNKSARGRAQRSRNRL